MRLAVTATPSPLLLREHVVALTERGIAVDAARLLSGEAGGDESLAALIARWFAMTPDKRRAVEAALEREGNQGTAPTMLRRPIDDHAKIFVVEGHHAAAGLPDGAGPVTAMFKYPSSFANPGGPLALPRADRQYDISVALGVVVGKEAESVNAEAAGRTIAGYTLIADVTDRTSYIEEARTKNGLLSKNLVGLSLAGPSLVLPADPKSTALPEIWLKVNGAVKQPFKPANPLWTAEAAIARWSETVLNPGDIIALGGAIATPTRLAPVPLNVGDKIEIGCTAIGTLSATVTQAA